MQEQLGGSTSCQLLDEGNGGITGSERETEVYASSLGERFYCNYGTGRKGIRVQEEMRASHPYGEAALLSEEPREAFLGYPISPSTRGPLCLAEN